MIAMIAAYPPANFTGSKRSILTFASGGPTKAATTPPAKTYEIARLRYSSLAVSVAANR